MNNTEQSILEVQQA